MKNSSIQINEKFLNEVIRQARIIHPKTLLDIGDGTVLARLNTANIGGKRTGVNAIYPSKLPFRDNSFHLVICSDVLQYANNPKKLLSEIYRVTKRYVILSVPNQPLFRLSNMLSGKNIMSLGSESEQRNNWTGDAFEAFAESKFAIFTNKRPFPWTVLVGEKL